MGGTNLPESEKKNVNQELIQRQSSLQKMLKGEKEACFTYYGPDQETGIYFVARGSTPIDESFIGQCASDKDLLDFYCFCGTDLCNSKVPTGVLNCHSCLHTEKNPKPGCVSATETMQTVVRNAATPDIKMADPKNPNKYQRCYTFEGTLNGIPVFARGKTYITEDARDCRKAPQYIIDQGMVGDYCYCNNTELCNNKPRESGPGGPGDPGVPGAGLGSSLKTDKIASMVILSLLMSL